MKSGASRLRAAHRYSHYIRKVRGVDFIERYDMDPSRIASPQDVRPLLAEALVFTEMTVEPLRTVTEKELQALTFTVRWGSLYDPEMIAIHELVATCDRNGL